MRKLFITSAALQACLPFSSTYFFRLCFGAGLNHWNSRLQPQTLLNTSYSFIIKGYVASWEKLLSYRQLHRLDQLLAPQPWNWGYKETLGSCGYQSRTVCYIYNSTAGFGCFLKQNLRHMFLLGFEWLAVTLKMHWIRRLQVENDSHNDQAECKGQSRG